MESEGGEAWCQGLVLDATVIASELSNFRKREGGIHPEKMCHRLLKARVIGFLV